MTENFFSYGGNLNKTLYVNRNESSKIARIFLKRINELPVGVKFDVGLNDGFVLEKKEIGSLVLTPEESETFVKAISPPNIKVR